MTLKEANAYVEQYHRHHKPVVGHKFSIGCSDGEKIVGVAIVGRPVARHLDDGWTLEVNRLCTDGTRNACSMLYAAAWRAARAMGYKRLVTYILESESGVSLKAAGWKCVGQTGGPRWTGKRRVNHPAHYTAGGIECIDAIAAALTCQKDPMQAWLTGQVLKYIWRWPLKNGKEDLRKARFYLDRLINSAGDD